MYQAKKKKKKKMVVMMVTTIKKHCGDISHFTNNIYSRFTINLIYKLCNSTLHPRKKEKPKQINKSKTRVIRSKSALCDK